MPQLKGIFYMDYSNYARWQGKIRFIDNIPVISFRYRLWLPMDPWQEVAEKINQSQADPSNASGYSAVVVHAWSYSLDDVAEFISSLYPHIKVVDPVTFFNLVHKNVQTELK